MIALAEFPPEPLQLCNNTEYLSWLNLEFFRHYVIHMGLQSAVSSRKGQSPIRPFLEGVYKKSEKPTWREGIKYFKYTDLWIGGSPWVHIPQDCRQGVSTTACIKWLSKTAQSPRWELATMYVMPALGLWSKRVKGSRPVQLHSERPTWVTRVPVSKQTTNKQANRKY